MSQILFIVSVFDNIGNTCRKVTAADIVELERILWKELGSKDDYDKYTKGMTCGSNVAIFIRSMVGVDGEIDDLDVWEQDVMVEVNDRLEALEE